MVARLGVGWICGMFTVSGVVMAQNVKVGPDGR